MVFHPEAEAELDALPAKERVAVMHAVEKLAAAGPALPFPHQSNVKGAEGCASCGPEAVAAFGARCTDEWATRS